jgi:hypothetical protein
MENKVKTILQMNLQMNIKINCNSFDKYDEYHTHLSSLIISNNPDDASVNKSDVYKAIKHLKKEKSDGVFKLMSDNFINGTDLLYFHLSQLFTLCLVHGYVPETLVLSTLIPIPKDVLGDLSNSDNYRGIALCCLCLKIFEYVLLNLHSHSLKSSHHQFAYKAKTSTTQCTWISREVIQYYNNNGSHVYSALLDCSKAFDKVKFDILFDKLISHGLSPVVVRFLLYSYTHSTVRVNWNNELSEIFCVSNGVRQGSVLSPFLFNIYMDELINNVKKEGYGCHIGTEFYGILLYSDDILLLAPTINALQKMLNVCTSFGEDTGLQYNCKKTLCVDFHGYDSCTENIKYCVYLNQQPLKWCKSAKHLGHTLTCCLTCDKDVNVKKGQFIACVNNILSEFSFAHHDAKLHLMNMYGTSFYGSHLWDLYGNSTKSLYTTWNVALRRIIRLPYRTHKRFLYHISKVKHIHVSLKLRFINFIISLIESSNTMVQNLLTYTLTSNLFCTGLNLHRILSEFDICSPQMFLQTYDSVRRTILCQYEKQNELPTEELYYCGMIIEMLNCCQNTHICGLSRSECLYMIEYLSTI